MREEALILREPPREPSWPPRSVQAFWARHRPIWVIAVAGAVVMAGVGAFGTGSAAPWTLYSYWFSVMVVGSVVSAVLLEQFEARRLFERSFSKGAVGLVLAVTLVMTPFVWLMAALAVNSSWRLGKMVVLAPQVLLLATALIALQLFLERRRAPQTMSVPAFSPTRPRLLLRLPARLAGARLHAVEAEDHYLRFHTDSGSALLLMRLGDAIAELQEIEGARTHRSWWVAREAVIGVSRGGGRAVLHLKGGLQAPVSRTYARALRKAGWF